MKKKYIFNIIGIFLVVILIISVNYVTAYLLDNIEYQRIKKINKISIKDNLDENDFTPRNIEEINVEEILSVNNAYYTVNDSNKNLLNMTEAINIALNDLKLFKEIGIILDEIDLDKINQTYAALMVASPYDIMEKEEMLESSVSIIQKSMDKQNDNFENLSEEYYFWNIEFVGENMQISVMINNYTGNIWSIDVQSKFDRTLSIKSNEEILELYSQYLGIPVSNEYSYRDENSIMTIYDNFNIGVFTYIDKEDQRIVINLLNKD